MAHLVADGLLSKIPREEIEVLLSPESAFAESNEKAQAMFKDESALQKLLQDVNNAAGGKEARAYYETACALIVRELGLSPREQALVVNGRVRLYCYFCDFSIVNTFLLFLFLLCIKVIGPIEPRDFVAADFRALEAYEYRKRAEPVVKALDDLGLTASEFDK